MKRLSNVFFATGLIMGYVSASTSDFNALSGVYSDASNNLLAVSAIVILAVSLGLRLWVMKREGDFFE